jgi:hypothetical protein
VLLEAILTVAICVRRRWQEAPKPSTPHQATLNFVHLQDMADLTPDLLVRMKEKERRWKELTK